MQPAAVPVAAPSTQTRQCTWMLVRVQLNLGFLIVRVLITSGRFKMRLHLTNLL
jgi:hypothetical protein